MYSLCKKLQVRILFFGDRDHWFIPRSFTTIDVMKLHEDYFRSMMFGLQDGIVSTTGVVAGISVGIEDRSVIILASLVAVAVEASSMGAGQYSSEKAVHQMDRSGKHTDSLLVGALIMFLSYALAGAIPITPMLLTFIPLEQARLISILSAFVFLFVIGYIKGKIVDHAASKSAIEMLLIGGLATIIGLLVGITLRV